MIAIVDYGVGNLFSLKCSLSALGEEVCVTGDPRQLEMAERIILPGVGAFEDAARKLRQTGLDRVVLEQAVSGKPLMGICLGMQMLFDRSYEYGVHEGLGLIPGEVVPMAEVIDPQLKIPHIGWNALHIQKESPIFKYVKNGDCVYFVHSYYGANCDAHVIATTEYDKELTAAVAKDNIFGCQFHPEKSGTVGLAILKAFAEYKGETGC